MVRLDMPCSSAIWEIETPPSLMRSRICFLTSAGTCCDLAILASPYKTIHKLSKFSLPANVNNSNMDKISEQLGKNMKRIRAKKKMSQGDIARALEVDRGYISNIENGKKNPTLATIQKLADALGVSADELLK